MTYKNMYIELFNNQQRSIEELQNAHLETETLFTKLENSEYELEAYEEAYFKLFNAATATIEKLKTAQLIGENSYTSVDEDSLFFGN
ncbi:MAG: hypothetical protein FWF50_01030 [Defluviitaleaceae bacterium]|nr:hypothetical protein [Defluviitaleaceae bacterium]